jgi:YceI-like protein
MRTGILIVTLAVGSVLQASEPTRLAAGAQSTVVLEGSSNVTDWRCRGTSMDADMLVATSADHINAVIDRIEDGNIAVWMSDPSRGSFPVPQFHLQVPVTSFRCGNRMMEGDMRHALEAGDHPHVEFTFRRLRGGVQHDLDSGLYHATIAGDLSLAGQTRTIDVAVSAQRISRTSFRIRAVLPLQMTDFRITPPTALFGAIRARDSLTVSFDLMLEMKGGR